MVDMDVSWQDKAHFMAIAANTMRRILVDYAKVRGRSKRGGGVPNLTLDEGLWVDPSRSDDILQPDDALTRLAKFDSRKCALLELIVFAGATYDEAAAALTISAATVHRELRLARAWLHRELHA